MADGRDRVYVGDDEADELKDLIVSETSCRSRT